MLTEEFDTSDLAWVLYKIFYGGYNKVECKNGRRYIEINIDNKIINMSGDTDYNFGSGWSHSIRNKYENYLSGISPEDNKLLYKTQLQSCENLYKSILNISLMPQTGNLQSVKKGIGNDRLDTFIWALNSYYIGETSLLFNHSSFHNTLYLKEYLEFFRTDKKDEDIYNYCLKIYGIKNYKLVDELIKFGKEAIDSSEKVIAYMNLAYRFWCQKLEYIKEMMKCNKNNISYEENKIISQAVKSVENELDKWCD